MSFRAAQDHKATGWDTTLLMSSSTQWDDPVAMTRRRSHFCFLSCRRFCFSLTLYELYSRRTCFTCGKLYYEFDDIYVCDIDVVIYTAVSELFAV
jgi:hypothetical protein